MKPKLRTVWLAACVLCFAILFGSHDSKIIFGLAVLALTFPAGILGFFLSHQLYNVGASFLGWDQSNMSFFATASYSITLWLLLVVPGYIQWFIFVPWLSRKLSSNAARM
jgi:hypothetical protein